MAVPPLAVASLSRFSTRRPPHEIEQWRALEWLRDAHTASEAARGTLSEADLERFRLRIGRLIERCGCGPSSISARGHFVPDIGRTNWGNALVYDVLERPEGRATRSRMRLFEEWVARYFEEEYAHEGVAPGDLIHVTCTGYVSPSGAQRLVERRGWGERTRVTHAYHMGCYAALPAIRLALGALHTPPACGNGDRRVDIVHTELCSLHLDPANHSPEQLVVQSLFGDGLIRYSVAREAAEPALRILVTHEAIVSDSGDAMTWVLGDNGMAMTLSRRVPEHIARSLRHFVARLYRSVGLEAALEVPRSLFAVHPGGPRILDEVRNGLELSEEQIRPSREVLLAFGNMSSATLPHVWMRIAHDANIASGTLVASLAFGPGLTVCGALFRKQ